MLTEILIFVITTLVGYCLWIYKKVHNCFDERGVKYLPGIPLFGNAFLTTFRIRHFQDDLDYVYRKFPEERYVGFIESTRPIILIRDPDLIKMITVKDFNHFTNHTNFVNEEMDPLFDETLIMMKGQRWHDMRTTLSPAFTGSKIKMMMPFMVETSKNILEHLNGCKNEEIDVGDLICRFTSDVIASAAFGLEVNSVKNKDNEFFRKGQAVFDFTLMQHINIFFLTQFPKVAKIFRYFNKSSSKVTEFFRDIVVKTIDYREKNKVVRPDMINLLIEASKGLLSNNPNEKDAGVGYATVAEDTKDDNAPKKTIEWTLDEIVGQVFNFFVAGFETTASSITICIHELALNPEIQERLYHELKEFSETETLSYNNVDKLKYLDCVLNETFRKWSAAIVLDRVCTKEYVLPPPHDGGKPYRVNVGDLIYNSVNSIHMDPKYWPEPSMFNPERFSEENKRNIKPFTFMPFGSGPRACIGSRFALIEFKVLLYHLLTNFKIVKSARTTDPIVLKPHDISVIAKGGTYVKMEPRN